MTPQIKQSLDVRPGEWVQPFVVHSYEVDFQRAASLETVCRYFLEAAWNHAEALGVGFQALAEQGKLWVLSRFLVSVARFPAWGEEISVRTWPRVIRSVFALRDFELLDGSSRPLVAGTSAWLILDASTRRPVRAEKWLSRFENAPARAALDRELGRLAPVSDLAEEAVLEARYSDVDVNGHVNSCRYIGWLTDSYGLGFHRQHSLSELEINYLGEVRCGERVAMARTGSDASSFSHSIRHAHDDEEVCRAILKWRSV